MCLPISRELEMYLDSSEAPKQVLVRVESLTGQRVFIRALKQARRKDVRVQFNVLSRPTLVAVKGPPTVVKSMVERPEVVSAIFDEPTLVLETNLAPAL